MATIVLAHASHNPHITCPAALRDMLFKIMAT